MSVFSVCSIFMFLIFRSKSQRQLVLLAIVTLLAVGMAGAEERIQDRRVMSWVPPYAVDACMERLNESFNGVGMKDGLTHLGLQFWNPTAEGGLKVVSRFAPITEATISKFRQWGETHGIRVMLCVYNGTAAGWDWDLATSAFETNRAAFVEALVSETVLLQLDGVDIDLEGNGKLDASKEAFVLFIKELSERLQAKGKELTLDTFSHQWHVPNQTWWPALLPHLDGLHVMGYSETGAGGTGWRGYDFLKAAAGEHHAKLALGMASHKAAWQGAPAMKHLRWIIADESVGVAIWDARLKEPVWRTADIWKAIAKIKAGGAQPQPAGK